LEKGVNKLGEIAMTWGMNAMSPKVMTAFSFAQHFLDVTGDVIMAWMHLWRATIAAPRLEKLIGNLDEATRKKAVQDNKQAVFYEGQMRCAEYYLLAVLPGTLGRMKAISACSSAVMDMPEAAFG
jgi:hypothetical protein